jgi:GTPase
MEAKKIVIVGRPNVGKSSLFNRLIGKKRAIVHDVAGTTRDIIHEKVSFAEKEINLYDTAGYLQVKGEISEAALKKVKEAVDFADTLVFTVDGNVSPTKEDLAILNIIRKSGKETLLVINKVDNKRKADKVNEYERFGFKEIFPISAIHNIGVGELVSRLFKEATPKEEAPEEEKKIKVALIGRPNVGKSSILNAICGAERAIVADIPGTTRDVVSTDINLSGVDFTLSDTAGARKPGKIGKAYKKGEPVEKFSNLRAMKEIENSDICLLIIDASQRIAAQDMHIAGKAKELGKGVIIVVNKWDLTEEVEQDKFLKRLRYFFNFMIWVPVIFVSAKTGRNIEELPRVIKRVSENQRNQIATSKLNRILEDFILDNHPKGLKNLKPKVYFVSQVGTVPPTFAINAKHYAFIHFSWRRAFENELRRHFDFTGTPIKIEFRPK